MGDRPDLFDRVAGNLRQQWYDDGLGMAGDRWEDQPVLYRLSYLADFAGAQRMSFERYAEAARHVLGLAPEQEFSAELDWYLKHEFHRQEAPRSAEEPPPVADSGPDGGRATPAGPVGREAFAEAILEDGFSGWPIEPGRLTRPGPEETPLQRVVRQITHIRVLPDPDDFRIEELGPWDTEASAEWQQLPEADKRDRLARQVDWRGFSVAQQTDVMDRVVAGEPPHRWLDGIEPEHGLNGESRLEPRPPSPSDIIANPAAYLPESVNGNDGGQDRRYER